MNKRTGRPSHKDQTVLGTRQKYFLLSSKKLWLLYIYMHIYSISNSKNNSIHTLIYFLSSFFFPPFFCLILYIQASYRTLLYLRVILIYRGFRKIISQIILFCRSSCLSVLSVSSCLYCLFVHLSFVFFILYFSLF